ncbi:MAG: hypothetical protein CHACPFDD_01508 [Phycisphaerae bacterium]|nr:hypothetical protein [Phycisphaerae bacterium]
MRLKATRFVQRAADTAVAFFFVFAGVAKLITISDDGVQHLLVLAGVSDSSVLITAAAALPYLEIVLGLWVVAEWRPFAAVAATSSTLFLFTLVLTLIGLRLGWGVKCGCTAGLTPTTIGMAIVRNVALLALLILPRAIATMRSDSASLPHGVRAPRADVIA